MRVILYTFIVVFSFAFAGSSKAQPWQSIEPKSTGWSVDKLQAAQDYAANLKPTAVMVVQDGKVIVAEHQSEHSAYPFSLSARDAARFGQLFLDGGRWNGKQIIPAAWVKESTTPYSRTDRGSMGYGYLWWTLNPDAFGRGAALASGYGGQAIAIVLSKRLVVVQIVDPAQNPKGVRTSHFINLLQRIAGAAL